jgi:hypothetical protein
LQVYRVWLSYIIFPPRDVLFLDPKTSAQADFGIGRNVQVCDYLLFLTAFAHYNGTLHAKNIFLILFQDVGR